MISIKKNIVVFPIFSIASSVQLTYDTQTKIEDGPPVVDLVSERTSTNLLHVDESVAWIVRIGWVLNY